MRRYWTAGAAALSLIVTLGCIAAVDARHPDWDAIALTFSRYVHTSDGWLIRIAILAAAVASAPLWEVCRRLGTPRWSRTVVMIGAGAMLAAAIVPADPPGTWPPGAGEYVHGIAGWIGFFSFVPVIWAVWWRTRAAALAALAIAASLGTGAMIAIWLGQIDGYESFRWGEHPTTLGLAERFTIGVNLAAVLCGALVARSDTAAGPRQSLRGAPAQLPR